MSGSSSGRLRVAIIGSGPAGFYTAEALAKGSDDNGGVEVDILDRLPTPYGLIRGGVAPDHQSIKGVFRRYEKTALQDNVRFIGNIEVGRDVSLAELRELYDAVVIATGAPFDRALGIPGEDKRGVVGSAAFVGWYNSHPDFAGLDPDLNVSSVVVIGNGNVAVDVCRILVKTRAEMAESDIAPYAEEAIEKAPLGDVWMLGRRGPVEAKFTTKELGELGELERCVALACPEQLPEEVGDMPDKEAGAKRKNLAHLQGFAACKEGDKPLSLHIKFYAKPVEILGGERVEGIRVERTRVENGRAVGTGETFDIPCQLVIPCIGYRSAPLEGAPFDESGGRFPNDDGLIEPGLYAVGWARRGPTGTIGTNRPDGIEIAEKILANQSPDGKPGGAGLDALIAERGLEVVDFSAWQAIEAAEEAAARDPAPRVKFSDIDDMMDVVRSARK